MTKVEDYRQKLRHLENWEPFLLKESGLPGPRGNLELASAVAEEGDENRFLGYLDFDPSKAPTNSPFEFLAFCGILGLGKLVSEGRWEYMETLRRHASDPRWRIREGVAMALQRLGDRDMGALLESMSVWSRGTLLEKRAAAAALCEPRLLGNKRHARRVLRILDHITVDFSQETQRRTEAFRVLKKGLGYCWSVAVASLPEEGKAMMEKWLITADRDVQWVIGENLKKNRLERMDPAWASRCKRKLGA